MIELFDSAQLSPRRDHSLAIGAGLIAACALGMAAYAGVLNERVVGAEAERERLRAAAKATPAPPPPTAALLAELQQQAERLEEHNRAGAASGGGQVPAAASAWLDRFGALASNEVSLTRIEVGREGNVAIEGQAVSPQAVSRFVQSFAAQERFAPVRARSIELKHDQKVGAGQLRFQMRAASPAPR
jgi:hypothetical protein